MTSKPDNKPDSSRRPIWKELEKHHFRSQAAPASPSSLTRARDAFIEAIAAGSQPDAFEELRGIAAWDAVAADLSLNARFSRLNGAKLTVEVPSSPAAQDLALQRPVILERLAQAAPLQGVRKIIVEVAGHSDPKRPAPGKQNADNDPEPLSPGAQEVLRGLGLNREA